MSAEAAEPSNPARARLRAELPSIVGVLLAAAAVVGLRLAHALGAVDYALVFMGFDPDRARLITALIVGALAGAIVAACAGRTAVAVLASLGAVAATFGSTFRRETAVALGSSGIAGTFDPVGWLLTLLTLALAAVIVGWAAATLTAAVRRYAVAAGREARDALRGRRPRVRGLARVASVAVVIGVLAVTLPVFSDLVNYSPDSHMVQGAPLTGGLAPGGGTPAPTVPPGASSSPGGPTASAAASALPAGLVAGPIAGSLVTPGILSSARPWAAHPPSGTGQVTRVTLPAPWTGGISSTANVDVYTPPGFGSGSTRYPVLYEAPYGIESWSKGVDIASLLDRMITTGQIPPMIMVFASTYGGPYVDSECADSYDGRERFDTYMATQLVPYIDAHYPTIAQAPARGLIGASQGGYCAAAVWSHHPDVFGASVSFSGYFVSGVLSAETQNAARPFGGNAAYEAKQSPVNVVPGIPAATAARSFVVLSADLANPFFGSQLTRYANVLAAAHVPIAVLPAPMGHSWQTQRAQLPAVLVMLAGRMAQLGVLGAA